MKKLLFFLIFLVCVSTAYSEKISTFKELMQPDGMAIGNDRIYVTEKSSIFIYSLKDFHFLKKIGKKGEGPGEFKESFLGHPMVIYPTDNQFIVNSYSKISFFTKTGEFIKENKIKPFFIYQPFGNQFISFGYTTNEKNQQVLSIGLCNRKFEKIKTLYISDINIGFTGIYIFPISTCVFSVYKDKIYIAGGDNFTIDTFEKNGIKVKQIRKECRPIKIPKIYEKLTFDSFKKPGFMRYAVFIKRRIIFRSHFPVIQDMQVRNDKIYVVTYKRENQKTECIILDLNGNELKRIYIPFQTMYGWDYNLNYSFYNNKFYSLVENEDQEVWELHTQDIR